MKGEVEVKLDDKIEIIKAGQAIRISPAVVRSIWNDKPEEVELLIVSKRVEDLKDDVEYVQDFWPTN
jgi:mannose-6-phosphate isomerase-like protein (cupin superfamily)